MMNEMNPKGKECNSGDGHEAYAALNYGPGRYAGFLCACCFREMWEATILNCADSIARLPAGLCAPINEPLEPLEGEQHADPKR